MKRSLSFLLAFVLSISFFSLGSASLSPDREPIIECVLSGNEAAVRKCSISSSGSVVIPDTYKGCPVTSIMPKAFEYCENITSVSMPDSITTVGASAFANCRNLASVRFSAKAEIIAGGTFYNCTSLKKIIMPEDLKTIESSAFEGCRSLEIIDLPSGTEVIYDNAFKGCTSLYEVSIPDQIEFIDSTAFIDTGIYNNGDSWTDGAFYVGNILVCADPERLVPNCTVRPGTVRINDYAFKGCTRLAGMNLPASLKYVNGTAFEGVAQKADLTVDPESPYFAESGNCLIDLPGKKVVSGFRNSVIPSDGSVEIIGLYAFSMNTEKSFIIIPEGITSVECCAFFQCSRLMTVAFPSTLKHIGYRAFTGTSLPVAGIPSGTEVIEDEAFAYSPLLASVDLPVTVKLGKNCFMSCACTSAEKYIGPFVYIGTCLVQSKEAYAEKIQVAEGTTSIADGVFRKNMQVITIPDSVSVIGENAFENPSLQIIRASRISYAYRYAIEKGIQFDSVYSDIMFNDVKQEAWYSPYVAYVYNNKYMSGVSDTLFGPDMVLTRGMFVTILAAVDRAYLGNYNGCEYFTDVKVGDWFAPAVGWAFENGLVTGTGEDRFSPYEPVTREQIAVMMKRFADHRECILTTNSSALDGFSDVSEISGWAVENVKWAVTNGMIAGADGRIMPRADTTRAQAAAMIRSMVLSFDGGSYNDRLTLALVRRILDAYRLSGNDLLDRSSFSKIFANIKSRHTPDYIGTGSVTVVEFWFDANGSEKIMVIPEKEEIYYLAPDQDSIRIFPEK